MNKRRLEWARAAKPRKEVAGILADARVYPCWDYRSKSAKKLRAEMNQIRDTFTWLIQRDTAEWVRRGYPEIAKTRPTPAL